MPCARITVICDLCGSLTAGVSSSVALHPDHKLPHTLARAVESRFSRFILKIHNETVHGNETLKFRPRRKPGPNRTRTHRELQTPGRSANSVQIPLSAVSIEH